MATPNLYRDGGREPFAAVPPDRCSSVVEVLSVTDRESVRGATGTRYGHGGRGHNRIGAIPSIRTDGS